MTSIQRITGLASGMDIDSIVEKMMTVAKQPLVKLQQQKQILEWQEEDYRTLNQKYFDFRSTLSNMKLTSKYRARTTTSSNESYVTATAANNASLGSTTIQSVKQLATAATRVAKAPISTDSSNKVDLNQSLWKQSGNFSGSIKWSQGGVISDTITAKGDSTDPTSVTFDLKGTLNSNMPMNVKMNGKTYEVVKDPSVTLSDNQVLLTTAGGQATLKFNSNISAGTSISVEYVVDKATKSATVSSDTKSIQLDFGDIITDSFTMTVGNNNVSLSQGTDGNMNLFIGSTQIGTLNPETGKIDFNSDFGSIYSGSAIQISYQQNYTSFNLKTYTSSGLVNGNFYIGADKTLNDVISKVNNSNLGLTMYYDEYKDMFTLTRKETGNFNSSSSVDGKEIIISSDTDTYDFLRDTLKFSGSTEYGGTNAVFNINGLDTERTSNTFTISGVTYTLKSEFDSPVTISVSNDVDTIYNNIKDFVDQYNSLIDAVQSKLNEDRYPDYAPLTDDQRKELTDTQQDQWDKKARSGLLRNDMTLKNSLSNMRSLIYSKVNNANISSEYNQLSSIGITTTSDWLKGGKLEINEDKLKAAIQNDPDSVELLFRASGSTTSEKGIVQRLYDSVNQTYNTIVDKAGKSTYVNTQFTIGKNINDLTDKIRDMNDKLDKLEDRYYAQFTAMEQAIQKYNSQYTYLSSFFSNS
ncbi:MULTISPECIES: flagellar filament capping protein FliD [Heyndrickxia]|uniref:flagellar filament capping protein FliD n=1 Tax=Heyndrickxia TaxID=2837504 RepID=UPI002DBE0711|nr:flagellar filament capping protein FliD [Weizmannia sp. CD-2023]MEC2303650.1 flagellar filament capping protein FliD [Weizmannia sp. CD-2023]MEC2340442.1 flagellar filament capping protein FliD [Weizmannia sp. CD-2023]